MFIVNDGRSRIESEGKILVELTFTDQICAGQRQLCAVKATYTNCAGYEHNEELCAAIHNAEQPQIDDILTKK